MIILQLFWPVVVGNIVAWAPQVVHKCVKTGEPYLSISSLYLSQNWHAPTWHLLIIRQLITSIFHLPPQMARHNASIYWMRNSKTSHSFAAAVTSPFSLPDILPPTQPLHTPIITPIIINLLLLINYWHFACFFVCCHEENRRVNRHT